MTVAAPTQIDPPAVACAWCGAPIADHAERSKGRAHCERCGAATTDPWPSDGTLKQAYADWYRPASGRFSGPGDALLKRSRAALAKRLDRIAPPGRVLDVGAGDGTLLDALSTVGRDAVGLELFSTRPDIRAQDIEDLEEDGFAAIVFWHSLEHLRRPSQALAKAAQLLSNGGVLIVAVPNSDSIQARLFGDRWLALDLPRHLVHLPAKALTTKLEQLGLKITRTSHLRGGQVVFGWLHGLVGLLPGHPDLYDAIRKPNARQNALPKSRRAGVLVAAALLFPLAAFSAAVEALTKRGGSIYVEATNA